MFERLGDLNLQYFVRTRRYVVAGAAALVASVLLAALLALPQFSSFNRLRSELRSERQSAAALSRKLAQLRQLDSVPVYQQEELINRILPDSKPVFELLSGIKQVAQQTQIQIEDISFSPGSLSPEEAVDDRRARRQSARSLSPSGTTKLELQLDVSGTQSQINSFLGLLNRITPITSVDEIKISLGRSGQSTETRIAELQLSSYFFSREVETDLESALPELGSAEEEAFAELQSFLRPSFQVPSMLSPGGLQDLFGTQSGNNPLSDQEIDALLEEIEAQ